MSELNGFTWQLPIVGHIVSIDAGRNCFTVKTRGGTEFLVNLTATSYFDTVQNLDRLNRLRESSDYHPPADVTAGASPLQTNLKPGQLIAVDGVFYLNGEYRRYDASVVHVLVSHAGYYLFEHTIWWKTQIEMMGSKWLDVLFGDKRSYQLDDFSALYRTTLNVEGQPVEDMTQEMATLSRLNYGLCSAFHLSGDDRYFKAASAGVEFQRDAFKSDSTDGRYWFWLHARKRDRHGIYAVLPAASGEDAGTMPLYEQIYALAGLAQWYRMTGDWKTLKDIEHTLNMFNDVFADWRSDGTSNEKRLDGFFSHIDPITFRWDSKTLDQSGSGGVNNRSRKNWNSVGDHLPAYLINVILALDPLPTVEDHSDAEEKRKTLARVGVACERILDVTSRIISEKFPEEGNVYVNERFDRDWHPIKDWGWQQNRAIVGHNLKIAWNLTRVANYYRAKGNHDRANTLVDLSRRIAKNMAIHGIDQVRSGVYDAVERKPADPAFAVQFAWSNTKDFWQQEQGILAYLILFGHVDPRAGDPDSAAGKAAKADADFFQDMARELTTVWNLYFLDHERNGIFFRLSDNGLPVLRSTYGDKGGHSISGYHAFELDYLAHIYQLAYLPRKLREHTTFCLHFRPAPDSRLSSINVLPDFLGADALEIRSVEVNGVERKVSEESRKKFQIPLNKDDMGSQIVVRLWQSAAAHERLKQFAPPDERFPDSLPGNG
jgi:mannose/cellobiose epimerase-like protein (N-acyl-D-glucosamine 2-epimerase family)